MAKQQSEKRKILIALGIVAGMVVLCVILFFLANVIVVDDCGGVPPGCRGKVEQHKPCPFVCEPLTLWEAIFGE